MRSARVAEIIANTTSVPKSDVTVNASAASVLMTVTISSRNNRHSASIIDTLRSLLVNASAASDFLYLDVLSSPHFEAVMLADAPLPPPLPPAEPLDSSSQAQALSIEASASSVGQSAALAALCAVSLFLSATLGHTCSKRKKRVRTRNFNLQKSLHGADIERVVLRAVLHARSRCRRSGIEPSVVPMPDPHAANPGMKSRPNAWRLRDGAMPPTRTMLKPTGHALDDGCDDLTIDRRATDEAFTPSTSSSGATPCSSEMGELDMEVGADCDGVSASRIARIRRSKAALSESLGDGSRVKGASIEDDTRSVEMSPTQSQRDGSSPELSSLSVDHYGISEHDLEYMLEELCTDEGTGTPGEESLLAEALGETNGEVNSLAASRIARIRWAKMLREQMASESMESALGQAAAGGDDKEPAQVNSLAASRIARIRWAKMLREQMASESMESALGHAAAGGDAEADSVWDGVDADGGELGQLARATKRFFLRGLECGGGVNADDSERRSGEWDGIADDGGGDAAELDRGVYSETSSSRQGCKLRPQTTASHWDLARKEILSGSLSETRINRIRKTSNSLLPDLSEVVSVSPRPKLRVADAGLTSRSSLDPVTQSVHGMVFGQKQLVVSSSAPRLRNEPRLRRSASAGDAEQDQQHQQERQARLQRARKDRTSREMATSIQEDALIVRARAESFRRCTLQRAQSLDSQSSDSLSLDSPVTPAASEKGESIAKQLNWIDAIMEQVNDDDNEFET